MQPILSRTDLPQRAAKSIIALLGLVFLMIPGPALPLARGLPIRTPLFFVGLFLWLVIFVLWPWRRDALRQAAVVLGLAGVAVVVKLLTAVLLLPNGLIGHYQVLRGPHRAKTLMMRRDPALDFQDNSFYWRQRGLALSFFNTGPFLGADYHEMAGMPLRVRWTGFIELGRRGTYRFAARCAGSWQISLDGRLVASRLDGREGGAYQNSEPGLHLISVFWEHPAEHPRPEFHLYWAEPEPGRAIPGTTPDPQVPCLPERLVPSHVLYPHLLGPGEIGAQVVVRGLAWVALALAVLLVLMIVFGQWRRPRDIRALLVRRLALVAICVASFVGSTAMLYRKAHRDPHWHNLGRQDYKIYMAQGAALNAEGWMTRSVGPFHRSSLMRFYCALGLWLADNDLGYFAMLQGMLGSVTVALVYVLGRRAFRRTGLALAAAGLSALEPSLLEFGQKFYATRLATLLLVATLACVVSARRRRSGWLHLAGMAIFGLAVLTRTNLLAAAPVLLWWCLGPKAWPWRHRLAQASLSLAAFAVVYSFIPLMNRHYMGHWLLTPTQGPLIAFHGNNVPREIDHKRFYPPDPRLRRLLDHAMDSLLDFDRNPKGGADVLEPWQYPYVNPYLQRIFLHYCVTHPGDFLHQLGVKATEFFWIDTDRRRGGNGGVRFRPYTIALVLAIFCVVVLKRDAYAAFLIATVLLVSTGLIAFLFVERHRVPLLPILHVLGVWAVMTLVQHVWTRRQRSAA